MRPFDLSSDLRTILSRISHPPVQAPAPRAGPVSWLALSSKLHWVLRAAIIVIAVSVATLVRAWLSTRLGVTAPYVTYFPAVLIVASLFGIADGVYAVIASAFFADYFFLAQGFGFRLGSIGDRVGLVVFLGAGVALSIVAGALRSRTWRMHHALEDLRASEERFFAERRHLFDANHRMETIVETAGEAIIGKDIHGIVTRWNKCAEAVFGYTAEEMVGQSIRKLLPPGHESEEENILAHILRNEPVVLSDAVRIAKDGHTVHLNLTVSPIRNSAGNIVGASNVARDITETLKLQKQLQQSQKMEAVGQLAGGIAHDFNNLLAIMLGALELQLHAIRNNTEALQRWEVANRAAMRGAELTRRLLAFSSMEHFKGASTSLNNAVRNTVEMARRLIGPEITVDLKLEDGLAQVLADPSGLESAVLNMIINARDAMLPKGGRITIWTRTAELDATFSQTLTGSLHAGAYACVSITDTGCGMSSEVLDRACEPFFTTKERGRGTGLGLSMVYGFVKHSGGGIRIYSEVGYGTTITFYLPFDRSFAQTVKAVPQKISETRRCGVILVVDDEAELLELSVAYLQGRGYGVLSATDASQALHLLEKHGPVDVMVTDIVMGGGMDGMELAQKVHGIYPTVRVIYSSGFPADALSERSLPLADSLVLQKPYRLADLGISIDHALGVGQLLSAPAILDPAKIGRVTAISSELI